MKKKDTYSENRIQNTFTAYLIKALQGVRRSYLTKKNKIRDHEACLEDMLNMPVFEFDGFSEGEESQNNSDYLDNEKLFRAIKSLRGLERKILYYHVLFEMTFAEIAKKEHLSVSVVKGHYYYTLTKIRNRMKEEL